MIDAPLALAFGAGLVATVNPCGFAMLPAYLSYFIGLGDEGEQARSATLRRALLIGTTMASAFLVVFGITGILITAGFRAVIDWIPWIALLIGVAMSYDRPDLVIDTKEKHQLNYPISLDLNNEIDQRFGPVKMIPTTLLLDPDGQVVNKHVGLITYQQLKTMLLEHQAAYSKGT